MESKLSLRQQMRQDLKAWSMAGEDRIFAQEHLNKHLTEFLRDKIGCWAIFKALSDEPDLQKTVGANSHIKWVYPRVSLNDLSFWQPSEKGGFVTGSYKIKEPDTKTSQQISLENIDGVIVPGMAFDRNKGRLGRGKGFYDRALARYVGPKVGVGFSLQLLKELPRDPWDIEMDALVTDKEIFRF